MVGKRESLQTERDLVGGTAEELIMRALPDEMMQKEQVEKSEILSSRERGY